MQAKKAQTTMVLLFLVVLIFGMLFIFMLSFAETVGQEEYTQNYLSSLLLSLVRTDTGYNDENCKLISDTIACSFISPTFDCEDNIGGLGDKEECRHAAEDRLTYYLEKFTEFTM